MARASKTIHIRVRTLDDVREFVTEQIPRYYRGKFVVQVAEYLAGILSISEPPYKYVSRASAYGLQSGGDWTYKRAGKTYEMAPVPGYFSAKQYHFVMAGIAAGRITPGTSQRTGETMEGWHTEQKGAKTTIVNKTVGARWTMNDKWQARQPALVGWQKTGNVIKDNVEDALLYAIDKTADTIKG